MSDESIRVDLDSLDQFASGVGGGGFSLPGAGGTSGLVDEFIEARPDAQLMLYQAPYYAAGGGLAEAEAFMSAHTLAMEALGQFMLDVEFGLRTLAAVAWMARMEYAYGDADSATVTQSVYRWLAPSAAAAADAERGRRQGAWDGFLVDALEPESGGLFRFGLGGLAIYAAGGTPADVERGRRLRRDAEAWAEAREEHLRSEYQTGFEEGVEAERERIERGGGETEEEGPMLRGDLGRGGAGTPIWDGDGQLADWIPYDDERVDDTPPRMVTEGPAGAGG